MTKQVHSINIQTSPSLGKIDAGEIIRINGKSYRIPSILLFGVMKCGTRALYTWLLEHPNLQGVSRPTFFDEMQNFDEEWPDYLSNPSFEVSEEALISGNRQLYTFDRNPNCFTKNFGRLYVAELLKKIMPSVKLLVILRNPTERAYSHYQMKRRQSLKGKINTPKYLEYTFAESVQDYLEKKEQSLFSRVFKLGHYTDYLSIWLKHFPREQLTILSMKDFQDDPFKVIYKIEELLRIPHFDYSHLAKLINGKFWTLKGHYSKRHNPDYEPMSEQARSLLDTYYKPWNLKLKTMFPETKFPFIK